MSEAPEHPNGRGWQILAAVEVAAAAVAVVADLLLPTLVLLGMAAVSLAVRRRGLESLLLRRPAHGWLLTGQMLVFAIAWTLLSLALFIPLANRTTGQRQDMSDFAELQGNLGMLALTIVLSWTLAAFGEELAFRGYFLTRLTDVLGSTRGAGVVAALVSSILFGLLHTQQGVVGVLLTTADAVAFAVLRFRFGTVWAPVLAHGFNNTIGFIAFFVLGPVYGFGNALLEHGAWRPEAALVTPGARRSQQEQAHAHEDRDNDRRLHRSPAPRGHVDAENNAVPGQALHQDQQRQQQDRVESLGRHEQGDQRYAGDEHDTSRDGRDSRVAEVEQARLGKCCIKCCLGAGEVTDRVRRRQRQHGGGE